VFQPLKAIASPRLIKNWPGSPSLVAKRGSSFANDNSSYQFEEGKDYSPNS